MGLPQVRWMVEAKLQQVPWLELDPERHPSSECSKEWCRPRHGASESTHTYVYWLVVYLPLWKMMEFVSWGYYSQLNGKIKHVPNHQPDQPVSIKVVEHPSNSTGFSHHGNHDFPGKFQRFQPVQESLVGAMPGPLKNMTSFVSWGYDIPNCFWKVIQNYIKFHGSSHHQPVFCIPLVYHSYFINLPYYCHDSIK